MAAIYCIFKQERPVKLHYIAVYRLFLYLKCIKLQVGKCSS